MPKFVTPTVQQMRLFEAVSRLGSITRAAEEVHRTQPSVSMQIRTLEEKVGLPLTELRGRRVTLTRAGEEVAAASRDILARLGEMETALSDLHRDVAGPLSIAVVSSAKYFLPQLLGQFKRRYPKVEPRLQITNRDKVLARLAASRDDIYITGRVPEGEAVEAEPFEENVIVFCARADHPLAGERGVPLSRIAAENVIRREPGSGTRAAVDEMFRAAGVELTTHMEFDDSEAIKQGVISGLGVASLSLHSLRLELAAGELAVLDVQGFPLHRRWYAVHRKGQRLSVAGQRFLDFLKQQGAGGRGPDPAPLSGTQ